MKDISEVVLPENLRYAESHEWANDDAGNVKIGISDYAQDQLGDIVFVEVPEVGDTIDKGAEFGTVESVKAVSELYLPIGGEIIAVNSALEESPELVNSDPYGDGWMVALKPENSADLDAMMSSDEYLAKLKG